MPARTAISKPPTSIRKVALSPTAAMRDNGKQYLPCGVHQVSGLDSGRLRSRLEERMKAVDSERG